jgi:5-methylcytosine-specific restriction protein A
MTIDDERKREIEKYFSNEIKKYFSVGDVVATVATGVNQSNFEIVEINGEQIRIKINSKPSHLNYLHLSVVVDNFKNISNAKNKTKEIHRLWEQKDLGRYSTTSQFLGLAKEYLKRKESSLFSSSHIQTEFELAVEKSKQSSTTERQKRLENEPKKPKKITTTSVTFKRNPDVVAEVLERAKGECEKCGKPAPFNRKKDNTPYLEVHHIIRLADDGDDTVENAIALCPNCHRKAHFG